MFSLDSVCMFSLVPVSPQFTLVYGFTSSYKLCGVLCLKYSNVNVSRIIFSATEIALTLMTAFMFSQLDNHGNHMLLTDESPINVPGIAAAHVIKRYTAQAADEISLEV